VVGRYKYHLAPFEIYSRDVLYSSSLHQLNSSIKHSVLKELTKAYSSKVKNNPTIGHLR